MARLLVRELVTNTVFRAGRGGVTLRAQLFERRVLVELFDEGDGFEPELRALDFQAPGMGAGA
jgi:anti-sigma regulatory factor (Ser/Thr protein kinase)